MKRDVAVRWAEWLLSNPDVKGTGRLAPDDNHRCCLGVLCEVLGHGTPSYGPLPEAVMDEAGMASTTGDRRSDWSLPSLTLLNDGDWLEGRRAKSFREIALYIEKHSDDL